MNKEKIIAKDDFHLRKLIKEEIKLNGYEYDLNHIDVSQVKDMKMLFCRSKFNGDISQWDVSNVENMRQMFKRSKFNGKLSNWDVSNVENMEELFYCSFFENDISNWDISKVKNLNWAFVNCNNIPWWNIVNKKERDKFFLEKKELEKSIYKTDNNKKLKV